MHRKVRKMKRTLILILLLCAALLVACTPGNPEDGLPEREPSQTLTEAETGPGTEEAGGTAATAPGHQTDSVAGKPKVTLPKDRF